MYGLEFTVKGLRTQGIEFRILTPCVLPPRAPLFQRLHAARPPQPARPPPSRRLQVESSGLKFEG